MPEHAPTIETERLILREWRESDLDAHAAMSADPEVARFLAGPLDRPTAWRSMALHVGHWALRGYGNWAVELKDGGEMIGRVGLWNPEGWFGVELGWQLARHAWGFGYATEAGRASLEWAFAHLDVNQVISVIAPANERSLRVAERLGMRKLREEFHHGSPVVIMGLSRADPLGADAAHGG